MEKQAEPDYDDLANLSDKEYYQLMAGLNELLEKLFDELKQDPEYSEFFDDAE
jgi:hypothetical protein